MRKDIAIWLDEVKRAERAKGQMSDEYKASLTERLELHIAEFKALWVNRGKKSDYKFEGAYKVFVFDAITHQINSIRWCRALLSARKDKK